MNKRIGIIAIIITILIIIGIVCIGWLDVFCLKSRSFAKQLTQNQLIVKNIKEFKNELSKDGQRDIEAEINGGILSLFGDSFQNASDIELKSNAIFHKHDFDINYELSTEDIVFQSGEIIRNKDLLAISVPSLFDGYIAMNQDNAKEVAQKLDLISQDETSVDYISNGKKIMKRYANILAKQVNDDIQIHPETISINEKEYPTKVSVLSITDRKLYEILSELSEKLSNDDEAITFIADCIMLSNRANGDSKSREEYIQLLNEKINEYRNNILNEDVYFLDKNLIVISLYSYNGKTIRTTIDFGDGEYYVSGSLDVAERYALINLKVKESSLSMQYTGKDSGDQYVGELSIPSLLIDLPVAKIIVKEKEQTCTLRNINQLNARFVNKMSDEELTSLKEEMQLHFDELNYDDSYEPFKPGEFVIKDESNRLLVLPQAKALYEKISPNMTSGEVVAILGEPDDYFDYGVFTYLTWFIDEEFGIAYPLVSVIVEEDMVKSVYIDIYSSAQDNIQISYELGATIDDLLEKELEIEEGMTKDEVIAILGDGYYEESKNELNQSILRWYDKNENSLGVEFDDEGKVFMINIIERGGI